MAAWKSHDHPDVQRINDAVRKIKNLRNRIRVLELELAGIETILSETAVHVGDKYQSLESLKKEAKEEKGGNP